MRRPGALVDTQLAASSTTLQRTWNAAPAPAEVFDAGCRDERRFDSLVRAQYRPLLAIAWRYVRSVDEAADIVQDVLMGVWLHEARFDYADPLPYLYRSVRNRALSVLRHARVCERHRAAAVIELRTSGTTEPQAQPEAGAECEELSRAIAALIDALPSRCRATFLLSRDGGLSNGEIARTLCISEKTVETQMTKALRSLRTGLSSFLS